MKKNQEIATLLLRLALATGFFSAVSGRLRFFGNPASAWKNFLAYTDEVNSFAPVSIIPTLAIVSTTLEILFAILLLIGYKTKWAALGSSLLTLLFALAMAFSFGIKEPLDYSVFVFSASAFLLANVPYHRWSIDEILFKNNKK